MSEFVVETVDIKRWLSDHTSKKVIEKYCKLYCTRVRLVLCFLKDMLFNYLVIGD